MKIIFTRQSIQETRHLRHAFKREEVTSRFLKHLYFSGYAEEFKERLDLDLLKAGIMPEKFDIHHIRPLSGGGSNNFSNLCLIEQAFHKFINRHCFDPALRYIKEGESVEIEVPDLRLIAFYQDYSLFVQEILHRPTRNSEHKILPKLLYQQSQTFSLDISEQVR